ncbi:MAG: basic amino acid ABC transporter substrate-binding protein [Succinivibrionaceae bacterium]|nr:basic amino acid ABC transporter substrate-binding protein [Succinivibrionaceae bacterium]
MKPWLKKAALAFAISGTMAVSSSALAEGAPALKVGCDGAFAPFTYINDNGELIGFDIDIIRAIGKELGRDLDIKSYPFDGIIPMLMTNTIDIIISGFTISPERAEKVNFSKPYYKCGLTFLVRAEDQSKYNELKDLKDTQVCVQIGTTGALYLNKKLPNAKVKQFNSPPETYIDLQAKGCSAVLNDKPVNDYFLAHADRTKYVTRRVSESDEEYYGIAVNKENRKLLEEINHALDTILSNGEFARISTEWFGYDITEDLGRKVSGELKGLDKK